ncbi:MAG: hypothetical protein IJ284_04640 [Clostridia bacterium]|nr:hypothetical protein [Clostridia bacterium]
MKRNNKKLLTLMLAGMLCAATAGTVAVTQSVDASAATKTYELTKIFDKNDSNSTIAGDEGKTALTFGNGDSVEYNRNLAINWFAAKNDEKYMSLKFTFKDLNFTEMSFAFESAPMHATKENSSVNTVKFINTNGTVSVKVLNGETENGAKADTGIVAGSQITLSLGKGVELGEYAFSLNGEAIGKFTNVGAKYFNTDSDMQSLLISAKAAANVKTTLYVDEINGQSFAGIADGKVTDNAKPVLVVNDEISTLILGAQFELDYKEIDVLDESVSDTKNYYQYNPTDAQISYTSKLVPNSSTGTYFMDTVIYSDGTNFSKEAKEGYEQTSLYRLWNKEYVSIRFKLMDDTQDSTTSTEYDLSWYATTTEEKTIGSTTKDFIILDRNTDGPKCNAWTAGDVEAYETKLQTVAQGVFAGSKETIALPSLAWLISDTNNSYQSLQFTISYKKPSSSTPTSDPNLDSDELKISATEPGMYEFKVLATDVAGNAMKALDNKGKEVKVTTDNIWDLNSVPSFTYTIQAKGIKTDTNEDKDTLDTQILGETYTMSAVDIVGVIGTEKSDFALYTLNIGAYSGKGTITTDVLSKIKFADLKTTADGLVAVELAKEGMTADKVDYNAINKLAYATEIAKAIGGDAAEVVKIFTEIEEYNSNITEDNEDAWAASDNKYNWKPASRSFTAAESGIYLILADYWDDDMMYVDHAPAYKLIEVEAEADVIKGETEWLKNNLISVILFSVAAVMLILIIILLLVKPSDETLEDIDEKAVSKRKAATDKHKKN